MADDPCILWVEDGQIVSAFWKEAEPAGATLAYRRADLPPETTDE